jgi:hypothetical protein
VLPCRAFRQSTSQQMSVAAWRTPDARSQTAQMWRAGKGCGDLPIAFLMWFFVFGGQDTVDEWPPRNAVKRIPRIIHQTVQSKGVLSEEVKVSFVVTRAQTVTPPDQT